MIPVLPRYDIMFNDGSRLTPGTLYCVGRNYALHALEMESDIPKEPVIFIKPPAALTGDGSDIQLPPWSSTVHHEVELVVVIGCDGVNVDTKDAFDMVAGYAIGVDLTARDVQATAKKSGEPWARAKGWYGSAPISTVISPAEVPGGICQISLSVNGKLRQHANTANMERSVADIISFCSHIFSLRRGDCIFMGTPDGVNAILPGDEVVATLNNFLSLSFTVK